MQLDIISPYILICCRSLEESSLVADVGELMLMEWPSNCYLKRHRLIRRGVKSSSKLMPVTLVPTEILNTSPRVLTHTFKPFYKQNISITLHIPGGNIGNYSTLECQLIHECP